METRRRSSKGNTNVNPLQNQGVIPLRQKDLPDINASHVKMSMTSRTNLKQASNRTLKSANKLGARRTSTSSVFNDKEENSKQELSMSSIERIQE